MVTSSNLVVATTQGAKLLHAPLARDVVPL